MGSTPICSTIHFDSRTIDQSVVLSFCLPKSASNQGFTKKVDASMVLRGDSLSADHYPLLEPFLAQISPFSVGRDRFTF